MTVLFFYGDFGDVGDFGDFTREPVLSGLKILWWCSMPIIGPWLMDKWTWCSSSTSQHYQDCQDCGCHGDASCKGGEEGYSGDDSGFKVEYAYNYIW